jgi:hypothetical protein
MYMESSAEGGGAAVAEAAEEDAEAKNDDGGGNVEEEALPSSLAGLAPAVLALLARHPSEVAACVDPATGDLDSAKVQGAVARLLLLEEPGGGP